MVSRISRQHSSLSNVVQAILGETPFVAVDVGAARGLLPHWHVLGNHARLYLVEPEASARGRLEEQLAAAGVVRNYRIVDSALAARSGEATLHVLSTPSGSSLLPLKLPDALDYASEKDVFPIRQVQVKTTTLPEMLKSCGEDAAHFMKLDTQGTELSILKALSKAARSQLYGVELEVGVPGAYEGQATLNEVVAFLEEAGLVVFDIVPKRAHLMKGGQSDYFSRVLGIDRRVSADSPKIGEVDAVFLRDPKQVAGSRDEASLRRLVLSLCVHHHFSHAYDLVERFEANNSFFAAGGAALRDSIVTWNRQATRQGIFLNVAAGVTRRIRDLSRTKIATW
jgi:FkbM family methyltransferase